MLRMGPGRGNRWGPRRQADPFQVCTDRAGVGDGCHDLHRTATLITYGQLKLEHRSQQYCSGQSVPILRGCGLTITAASVGLLVC